MDVFAEIREKWVALVMQGETIKLVPSSAPWLVRTFRDDGLNGWVASDDRGTQKVSRIQVVEEVYTAVGFVSCEGC